MTGGRLQFAISVQPRQMAGATVQLQWRVGRLRGTKVPASTSVARSSQLRQLTGTGLVRQMAEVASLLRQMAAALVAAVRRAAALKQYGEDIGVPGGQLTLELIAAHNQDFPGNKVSLADLKPNRDPDFQCKGAEP